MNLPRSLQLLYNSKLTGRLNSISTIAELFFVRHLAENKNNVSFKLFLLELCNELTRVHFVKRSCEMRNFLSLPWLLSHNLSRGLTDLTDKFSYNGRLTDRLIMKYYLEGRGREGGGKEGERESLNQSN